jgi:hypothetical protein
VRSTSRMPCVSAACSMARKGPISFCHGVGYKYYQGLPAYDPTSRGW